MIEQGKVFIDNSLPKWTDRSIFEIGDELRGYKYDELDVCLSDDASSFVYKLEENKKNDKEFSSNSYKLFDFGRTVTGFFNLNLKVKAKTDLYILWDEIIWHEDKPGRKKRLYVFIAMIAATSLNIYLSQVTLIFLPLNLLLQDM